nr:alpha/beta fold hydrolase [Microbacterium testaceum]
MTFLRRRVILMAAAVLAGAVSIAPGLAKSEAAEAASAASLGDVTSGITDAVPGVLDGVEAVLTDATDLRVGESGLELGVDLGGLSAANALDTTENFAVRAAISQLIPEQSPPGSNDFSCQPRADRPPVVLVHGTFENAYANWAQLSSDLSTAGYCVFALNYGGVEGVGVKGVGDIPTSAGQLSTFVDAVLAETGADEVDLVGHSQGGMMPRYYLKELGGTEKVRKLVGLSSSNYGTTENGVLPLLATLPGGEGLTSIPCAACVQQREGSEFLTDLNAGGDTLAGVEYTVISTVYDEVVTPYTNTFLRDEAATNITVQDVCAADLTDHLGITYDPIALRLVQNALDPSTAVEPACAVVPPLIS